MIETNYPAVIIASITAFLFLVLLAIVLIANARNQINRIFAFYLLSSFGWSVFTALAALPVSVYQEYLFNWFLNIFGIFPATVGYFFFCLIFLKKSYRVWLFYAVPSYLIFTYVMSTDAFTYVTTTPLAGGFGFHGRQQPGEFLYLAVFWGASFIAVLLAYLLKDLFTAKDKIHLQKVKLLVFTTLIGSSFAILFNAVPELWVFPVDVVGQLLAAAILAYAILRFELVDVATKFRNVIVETIFTTILAASFLFILIWIQLLFHQSLILWGAIILAIFITSLSQPFKERVLKFVDITFYRTRYDYRETINKFTKRVGEILDFQNLSESVIKTIKNTFGSKDVYLFVLYKGVYQPLNGGGSFQINRASPIISFLKTRSEALSKEDIVKDLSFEEAVASLKPEVIVPMKAGDELVGILFIKERVSGDFYSSEDKNLLFTLAQSSAIALKNALLYQEVLENKADIERLLAHEREVNESKNEFVTIASHYLRTPLTSIKGYLDLLSNERLSSKTQKEYLSRVINEQKKLSTLVEDLISISALEQGRLKLFKTNASLNSIVKKVAEDFATMIREKKLSLKLELPDEDIETSADAQKLTHAVSNLVDNAVKFTSVGSITLSLKKLADKIGISVTDTGIGIEEEQKASLFQKFHRGTEIKTFNYAGSGLGLYITKLIVDAHGGDILVTSKIGKGSTFCIRLPVES